MEEKRSGPERLLYGFTFVMDCIYRVLVEYSKLVLLIIVFIVSAQVISRKVLNTSIRWSEEVALLMMVWMAFISLAIGVEKKVHIAITMFFDWFPKPVQKVITKINEFLVMMFGLGMIVYGCLLVESTTTSTLPATQWPACMLYIMIPVSGVFIVYFTILELFHLEKYRHKQIEDGGEA